MDSLLRKGLRNGRALFGEWTGRHARAIARLDGSRVAIFTYHRVLPASEAAALDVEPGMYVTPETFARQAEWLASEFTVLPLAEVVARLASGEALPKNACAITFDDGWRDNYTHAWPALRRFDLPSTIFLVARRVGTPGGFWTDDLWPFIRDRSAADLGGLLGVDVASPRDLLERLKSLGPAERADAIERIQARLGAPERSEERPLLDWDEVGRMASSGVCFECHGSSHDLLTTLDDDALGRELRDAQEILLAHGVGRERLLAYPNGAWDERVATIARREGIRAAVTTGRSLASPRDSAFALPRIGVHDDVSRTHACFRRLIANA